MDNNKTNICWDFQPVFSELKESSYEDIECGVMHYCLTNYGHSNNSYNSSTSQEIYEVLSKNSFPIEIEAIIQFFESMVDKKNKSENGIVFTPKYISNYITELTIAKITKYDSSIKIIVPGCGCGIFILSAIEKIISKFKVNVDTVIENNIFGIDIDKDNVRRCKLILKLISAKYGGDFENIRTNIDCADSLKINWCEHFSVDSFMYVIGNPPYVNTHDMNKETAKFLKETFSTTKNGVFNIFYAFIEKAMDHINKDGILGYIIPNNFLTIKSALELREFLQKSKLVHSILDFSDNMVFKPVRTYNCIITITPRPNNELLYHVMEKVDDIENKLKSIKYEKMDSSSLDKNGWKLVDEKTKCNLQKIESQANSIKGFIRTGIATLRDGVYLVDCDENGYKKCIGNETIYIESELIKPIYKIPELKNNANIDDAKRFIIFPYIKSCNGYALITEDEFREKYPQTYRCLEMQKGILNERDKGKGVARGWYAYGRSQGLNKYGRKLLFPTFASVPRFTYVDNEDALFCNGYAVFENDKYDLAILQKILNSKIMQYYVANTSYSIEGGYYCYQKKYIERFSIPQFTDEQLSFIKQSDKDSLDSFLWEIYDLE